MIYLIDDNQNNQIINSYNLFYIEEGLYSAFLKHIDKIEKVDGSENIDHLAFLGNATCLLVHKTTEDIDTNGDFIKGSNSNVIKIAESISVEGKEIPLVLFSNKMDESAVYNYESNPNYILGIKKNKFYERLRDFLEHYNNNAKVDLRIIAYGKSFISEEVSKLGQDLLMDVAFEVESGLLKITHISSLNTFRKFISIAGDEQNFDNIITSIEDNPITIQEYRDKLNSIVESYKNYGKNIYNW